MCTLVLLLTTLVPAQAQNPLHEEVKKLGGTVENVSWFNGKPFKEGIKFRVKLRETKINDNDLKSLRNFTEILFLDVSFTSITDGAIDHIAAMPSLGDLDIANTRVTDEGLQKLHRSRELRKLRVANTRITDRAVTKFVNEFRDVSICKVATGDKSQYSIFEEYKGAQLAFKRLMIGDTYFGDQLPSGSELARMPTTYYHRNGPVGQVLKRFDWFGLGPAAVEQPSNARLPASLLASLAPIGSFPTNGLPTLWSEPAIGVIRVNAGTHAAYGQPFQRIDFYNSTPELAAFCVPPAGETPQFTYIRDAQQRGCVVKVFDGDERRTLARTGPKQFYSALFVEITRTDLRDINTNLFTQEAIGDFMESLIEEGILCFHTSHRYHDMVPPPVDAAKALGLAWKRCHDQGTDDRIAHNRKHFGSEWVMIARKAAYLDHLKDTKTITWSVPPSTGMHLWSDGGKHDLDALKRDSK